MKWSEGQVNQLRGLAAAGAPNKDIAQQLGVGINEVYAKRSQLGITIDKVRAAQAGIVNPEFEAAVQDMDAKAAASRELDNEKKKFIKQLESLLIGVCPSIEHLTLTNSGNAVSIDFGNYGTNVNIEGDSFLAIIADVTRKILF